MRRATTSAARRATTSATLLRGIFGVLGLVFLLGCLEQTSTEVVDAMPATVEAEPAVSESAPASSSVLLVVVDTLRADAVSSLGPTDDTTPTIDALARTGTRYERVYAPAPWTIPTHASLLSGLRPDEHGVGLFDTRPAGPEFESIAERLSAAGYQTAGFSENMLVGEVYGFDQGFDVFESLSEDDVVEAMSQGRTPLAKFDLVGRIARWSAGVERRQPFFVFVNIFDAHDPYEVRETNPFLPDGVGRIEASATASRHRAIRRDICDALPPERDVEILRGLYLGDVAAADRKLDDVLRVLRGAGLDDGLITIVTSDHGEHFGEHALMQHGFSLRQPLLHVPLVVHGREASDSGVVSGPVDQLRVPDSILCWTLGERCARQLPQTDDASDASADVAAPIVATFSDEGLLDAGNMGGRLQQFATKGSGDPRSTCGREHRVFGRMASLVRHPFKLIWYSDYPSQLYDLSWDPHERSDQMTNQSQRAAAMADEMREFLASSGFEDAVANPDDAVGSATTDALRALGYIE